MRAVILDNLRSAYNVGSIIRTAAALKYNEVYLCGVTITPPASKLKDTSRGMEEHVTWQSFSKTEEAAELCRNKGYHLIAIETTESAKPIKEIPLIENGAFFVGNEAHGLSEHVLNMMDDVYALPMPGEGISINVSCAFAAVAYQDYLKQS